MLIRANKNDISFKAISSGQEDPSDILTGKTTAKLNVRKGPGTKYAKMGTLSKGAKVEVITKLPSGWYKIKYKGTYGYVLGKYVKLNTPQQDEKVIATGKTTAQLNVRKGSSTKYAKIGSLSKGAKVEIVSKLSNGWYKIKYKGTYGYVSGAYVKLDSEQPKPGEDEKIIAIPYADPNYNEYKSVDDLPSHIASEMSHFFSVYKALEGKDTAIKNTLGVEESKQIIKESISRYKTMFGK